MGEAGSGKKKKTWWRRVLPAKMGGGSDKSTKTKTKTSVLKDATTMSLNNVEVITDIAAEPPINERFKILAKIGSGSFGQIYKARDLAKERDVAVKTESRNNRRRSLRMDVAVLQAAHRSPAALRHFARFGGSGSTDRYSFVIMDLLGPSLSDLRKRSPLHRLSVQTSLRIAVQAVQSLEELHILGYVHRDVKPSNFAFGLAHADHNLVVFDFGLTAQFRDAEGTWVVNEHRGGFKGTIKYASTNAHRGKELGRVDDLWMLWYSLVELLRGELPWRSLHELDDVRRMKERLNADAGVLLQAHPQLPRSLCAFPALFAALQLREEPDYTLLIRHLQTAADKATPTDPPPPWDWEEKPEYASLFKEEELRQHLLGVSSQPLSAHTPRTHSRRPH